MAIVVGGFLELADKWTFIEACCHAMPDCVSNLYISCIGPDLHYLPHLAEVVRLGRRYSIVMK